MSSRKLHIMLTNLSYDSKSLIIINKVRYQLLSAFLEEKNPLASSSDF